MPGDGQGALDIAERNPGPFSMHSYHRVTGWGSMVRGDQADRVWRPRTTAADAIVKCLAWAGTRLDVQECIPPMQVVDDSTGAVVWRSASYHGESGDPVGSDLVDDLMIAAVHRRRADGPKAPSTPPRPRLV